MPREANGETGTTGTNSLGEDEGQFRFVVLEKMRSEEGRKSRNNQKEIKKGTYSVVIIHSTKALGTKKPRRKTRGTVYPSKERQLKRGGERK